MFFPLNIWEFVTDIILPPQILGRCSLKDKDVYRAAPWRSHSGRLAPRPAPGTHATFQFLRLSRHVCVEFCPNAESSEGPSIAFFHPFSLVSLNHEQQFHGLVFSFFAYVWSLVTATFWGVQTGYFAECLSVETCWIMSLWSPLDEAVWAGNTTQRVLSPSSSQTW